MLHRIVCQSETCIPRVVSVEQHLILAFGSQDTVVEERPLTVPVEDKDLVATAESMNLMDGLILGHLKHGF